MAEGLSNEKNKEEGKTFSDNRIKNGQYWLLAILAFNLFFLIWIGVSIHNKEKVLLKEIHTVNEYIADLEEVINEEENNSAEIKSKDETIEFLESQYDKYFEFADKDRASFFNLVNIFFVALGVLVTGAIVVIYWMFGQSREEVRKNADREIEASLAEIKSNAEEKIGSLIDPKITEYEERLNELTRLLDTQHKLTNSNILLICNDNQKDSLGKELKIRAKAIVNKVEIHSMQFIEEFQQFIEENKMDMIIYLYEESYENEHPTLGGYLELLIEKDSRIPIIIYTGRAFLSGLNLELANQYPYSTFANMPTTLTTSIISLSNIVSYERKDEDDC